MTVLTLGSAAPDIEISSTGDKTLRLSDLKGKNIVLYFYPKDNTPGCTQEGRDFRDLSERFAALNTVIFGVSRDSVKMHEGFKCKQEFPFDLLSDPDEALCGLFDVIKMKSMYGKQVRGIERSTFLFDSRGNLVREWRKVKVKEHAQDVLQAVEGLN
ncbi:peroxiredoxin [Methylomicrobium lacus]|uniref:peroxiredoxin n=1 Tax=Methylomicrobium lacus TaxID=136992 RepID=UPI0035A85CF4